MALDGWMDPDLYVTTMESIASSGRHHDIMFLHPYLLDFVIKIPNGLPQQTAWYVYLNVVPHFSILESLQVNRKTSLKHLLIDYRPCAQCLYRPVFDICRFNTTAQ